MLLKSVAVLCPESAEGRLSDFGSWCPLHSHAGMIRVFQPLFTKVSSTLHCKVSACSADTFTLHLSHDYKLLEQRLCILFPVLPKCPARWSLACGSHSVTTGWFELINQTITRVQSVISLSRVRLFATPWTAAYQDPPSMRFSRQEYWSGLPFPSPGTSWMINFKSF